MISGQDDSDVRRAVSPNVAVIIPCRDEERAVAKVVADWRAALPGATVFVFDNGSADCTADVARRSGAVVRSEPLPGKGNVVRRMFADVEADVYVMVDGDDTYDSTCAPQMIDMLMQQSLDMVSGVRLANNAGAYRAGHRFGNWLLTGLVARIFGNRSTDMLSGYRVMSRRFVKSFPALSRGFEIETEITVHALQLRCPMGEFPTPYKERPPGSSSKLSTYRDGFRILRMIALLIKEELPLQFFSVIAALLIVIAVLLAVPILQTYLHTGLVPRLPTAVLATGLVMVATLSLACGLILSTVTRARNELKRLHYLSYSIRLSGR